MDHGSCKNCRFFSPLDNQCRAEPPKVFPITVGNGNIQLFGGWPPVREEQWCGYFDPDLNVVKN